MKFTVWYLPRHRLSSCRRLTTESDECLAPLLEARHPRNRSDDGDDQRHQHDPEGDPRADSHPFLTMPALPVSTSTSCLVFLADRSRSRLQETACAASLLTA
jgi:hypothetical protein